MMIGLRNRLAGIAVIATITSGVGTVLPAQAATIPGNNVPSYIDCLTIGIGSARAVSEPCYFTDPRELWAFTKGPLLKGRQSYHVENTDTRCLTTPVAGPNANYLYGTGCSDADGSQSEQLFYINYQSSGWYMIQSVKSLKCLGTPDQDGAYVYMDGCSLSNHTQVYWPYK